MTIDISLIRNTLQDFYREWITDKFVTIKNIDETDFDLYSGDVANYAEDLDFISEYEQKYEILSGFIDSYDVTDFYWMDLETIANANPMTDNESVLSAFTYLNQFINKIEAEQNMIGHFSKD